MSGEIRVETDENCGEIKTVIRLMLFARQHLLLHSCSRSQIKSSGKFKVT